MHDDEILDYDFDVRVVASSFVIIIYDRTLMNYILKKSLTVANEF
jgi:hypothetical protein